MASGKFEVAETNLIREFLVSADLFINIGANVGYYCCHALSLGANVIAVEPNTTNLHFLLSNIKENGWSKRTEIYPVALGKDTDILEIWGRNTATSLVKGWANNPTNKSILTPVLKLDSLSIDQYETKKRPLILIDVEGYELMTLQGASKTLKFNPKPIWVIEIALNEHHPEVNGLNPNFVETFELFFKNGYKAFALNKIDEELIISDIRQIASYERTSETHNYVFV